MSELLQKTRRNQLFWLVTFACFYSAFIRTCSPFICKQASIRMPCWSLTAECMWWMNDISMNAVWMLLFITYLWKPINNLKRERDLAPSTLSTNPPPYLSGVVGTQFTGGLQEGWIWTVKWRFAASPTQILCFWIMYAILSLLHLESCFWSVYQMIGCLVLVAVIFLGWLTTTRNKRVSSCAFITFSWAVSRTTPERYTCTRFCSSFFTFFGIIQ
jgi:hypothetical protein